ncbi:MAG: MBL fold metallo-hydrolase [Muribaculaceae bacterium]|nr:MBL fold metallo-hydrolase [Muribaculaceae bacterium]
MLKVKKFTFNNYGESTYLVIDPDTLEAAIVDPGMISPAERHELDQFIDAHGIRLTQIVNTHLHLDHCFGHNYVRTKYGIKAAAYTDDEFLTAQVPEKVVIDTPLADGDTITIGSDTLQVLHVPGHSPGSVALYSPTGGFVLTGDALFQGSIGRTDLPGGNMAQLLRSIKSKLLTLPGDTVVLPGHGPRTTIAAELRTNPFLR